METKIDLRDDPVVLEELKKHNNTLITREMGEELRIKIGAVKYVECSSLLLLNLQDSFSEAILSVLFDEKDLLTSFKSKEKNLQNKRLN